MPGEIVEQLRLAGHDVVESAMLEESIAHVDIVYSTRIQEERFSSQEEADMYRGRFRLNQSIYTHHCEPNTVIMHPLPRDSRDNARELDDDERAPAPGHAGRGGEPVAAQDPHERPEHEQVRQDEEDAEEEVLEGAHD